jgi:hypothetical protein
MRYSRDSYRRLGLAIAFSAIPAVAIAQQPISIQHVRPVDQRGVNVFEPPKKDTVEFKGTSISWGAAFTQQFQALDHSNTAAPKLVNNVDQNKLIQIGHGFNNAVANLYLNGQLAKGIRVSMTSYLSARHHNEAWVKDGYLLIDDSPINFKPLNDLMKYVTVKAGHFEINYGDGHFRRTDNGNGMYNPFVGNYVMDAFTTEVGGEVYVHDGWWQIMGGVTNGEIRGMVLNPGARSPAFLGKAGIDRKLTEDLRVRLMGSVIRQKASANQSLYGGDRAGSRYYDVLENTASTETANAWSGMVRNPFTSKLNGFVINPFIKYRGLELFGQYEEATGNNGATETTGDRTWKQTVAEGLYRFAGDHLYLGGRYNTASGKLFGITPEVSVDRYQFGGGWFVTPNILTKLEYVNQKYNDFPTADIRNGGKFKGFMIEGVVAF